MAEYIKKDDFLNDGRVKINAALTDANTNANKAKQDAVGALAKSLSAEQIAQLAKLASENTQQQLDDIILKDGNDIAEVVQARGGNPLLKDRLNKSDSLILITSENLDRRGFTVSSFGAIGDKFVDDTDSVQEAINTASTYNVPLIWDGEFKVSKSLDDIHKIKHQGKGKLVNGDYIFTPNPSDEKNIIYVSNEFGDDVNDGISPMTSVKTIQRAMDILGNYYPVIDGEWEVNISNGVYEKFRFPKNLYSKKAILISGEAVSHPNEPTTIISNGTGHLGHGSYIEGNVQVNIKNIKYYGFNGNGGTSSGVSAILGANVKLNNCHFEECFYGTQVMHGSNMEYPNCIFKKCGFRLDGSSGGAGHRSIGGSRHYIGIQDGDDFSKGCLFEDCFIGVLAMDNCHGHINTNTFQMCNLGMRTTNESRINGDNNRYFYCIIAIEAQNGGTISIGNSIFEKNTMNFRPLGGGRINGQLIQGKNNAYNTTQEINTAEKIDRTYTHTYRKFYEQVFNYEYFKANNASSNLGRVIDFVIQGSVSGNNTKRVGATIRGDSSHQNIALNFSGIEQGRFKATGKIVFHRDGTQTLMLEGGVHDSSYRISTENSELSLDNVSIELSAGVNNSSDYIHVDYIEMRIA